MDRIVEIIITSTDIMSGSGAETPHISNTEEITNMEGENNGLYENKRLESKELEFMNIYLDSDFFHQIANE